MYLLDRVFELDNRSHTLVHCDSWHFYCQSTSLKALLLMAAKVAPAPDLSEKHSFKAHLGSIYTLSASQTERLSHVLILCFKMDTVLLF